MAKTQRVAPLTSLIYKTAFLLYQKDGSKMRAGHQICLTAGEKGSD